MSPERQRIVIAEIRGWTNVRVEGRGLGAFPFGNIPKVEGRAWTSTRHMVPNYLGDLNEMQEAEKDLIGRNNWELCAYVHRLHAATNSWPVFATAAQRAEAFIRVHGKWEEGRWQDDEEDGGESRRWM